jgi:protein TonB
MAACAIALGALALSGCASAVDQANRPPQIITLAKPVYPFEMRRAGISGQVKVELIVDQDGQPRDLRVVKSTMREFEPAALAAIAKWRFKPGLVEGKPVKTLLEIPIEFTLDEK